MTSTTRTPARATQGRVRRARLAGATALAAGIALAAPAAAVVPAAAPADDGYEVILDGTPESFDAWEYAGDGGFDRLDDGTVRSRAGAGGGFGTLWYPVRQYGDFSMVVEFRDDAPGDARANSGIQVRFPDLSGPVEGCPTTFNGNETGNLSWIAVNCGHEIQVNDSPEGGSNDPRKTGSVYGFADIGLDRARPTAKGTWNELEVRVVGQHYTVIRDGVVINEYENLPGVPFPDRPLDPGPQRHLARRVRGECVHHRAPSPPRSYRADTDRYRAGTGRILCGLPRSLPGLRGDRAAPPSGLIGRVESSELEAQSPERIEGGDNSSGTLSSEL